MRRNQQQTQSDIRKLQLLANTEAASESLTAPIGLSPVAAPSALPQAANILRNGDASHSVRTWFETANLEDDENKECAHWFSHDAPIATQQLYANDSKTGGSPNQTLKFDTHTAYDADFSDWERARGIMRLTGTKTLDAPFPSNIAGAGKTEFIVMIIARRNEYISLAPTCRMFGGIWDNTAGQRDWLASATAFTLSGGVTDTPAVTVERRYKIYARTDRGYDYLSTELVVANAPTDASYLPGSVSVALRWTEIPNTLIYSVYRYTPSTGEYLLLHDVGSGALTYDDNNTREDVSVSAYPTASDDRPRAYFATRENELSGLAVDGVAARWNTMTLPVRIPSGYNQSLTTDKQWARIGLTEAPDLKVLDAVTNGTSTVTSAAAQFQAEHTGLTAIITNGVLTETSVITYVDTDEITLAPAPAWTGTGNTLLIVGGGFHGVLIDLVHSSYQSGAVYAPNAEDLNRVLQPIARPNGSTQGGIGDGGTPIGGLTCVWDEEFVNVYRGSEIVQIKAKDVRVGDCLASGNMQPNYVEDITTGQAPLYLIETANGWRKYCSPSHPVITSMMDASGTRADKLTVGDKVLTDACGVKESSKLAKCEKTGRFENVRTFSLAPGHLYVAGHRKLNPLKRLINWLFKRNIFGRSSGGIYCHNRKLDIPE